MVGASLTMQTFFLWYMGATKVPADVLDEMKVNGHMALLSDPEQRSKIMSYMDISRIPKEYRAGRSYYDNYTDEAVKNMYPVTLSETSGLKRDANLTRLVSQLFHPSVSPLFSDREVLVGQPKAYMILLGKTCDHIYLCEKYIKVVLELME
jgi:hypothetical protein